MAKFKPTHLVISKGRRLPVAYGESTPGGTVELVGARGETGWYLTPSGGLTFLSPEGTPQARPDARIVEASAGAACGPSGAPSSAERRAELGVIELRAFLYGVEFEQLDALVKEAREIEPKISRSRVLGRAITFAFDASEERRAERQKVEAEREPKDARPRGQLATVHRLPKKSPTPA